MLLTIFKTLSSYSSHEENVIADFGYLSPCLRCKVSSCHPIHGYTAVKMLGTIMEGNWKLCYPGFQNTVAHCCCMMPFGRQNFIHQRRWLNGLVQGNSLSKSPSFQKANPPTHSQRKTNKQKTTHTISHDLVNIRYQWNLLSEQSLTWCSVDWLSGVRHIKSRFFY